jgi:hypothetical protein
MSIANELSCDVAAAVFTEADEQTEPDAGQMTELVLTLHTTLRQMLDEARDRRRAQRAQRTATAYNTQSAEH